MHRAAAVLGVVAAAAIVAGSLLPGSLRMLPFYSPRLTHVVVYALLAAIFAIALSGWRRPLMMAFLAAGTLGTLTELAQRFVPVRTASLEDVALNWFGAAVGAAAFVTWQRVRSARADLSNQARPPEDSASRMAKALSRLGNDRLTPVASLLRQRGLISAELAAMTAPIRERCGPAGNPPAADRMIIQALEQAGIRTLVLKGTLLAHTVYPEPRQRLRGDTDLLVAPADRGAAEETLRSLGMAPTSTITAKTSHTQDQWHGQLDAGQAIIDLHWQVINHPAFDNLFEFEQLWQRRQPFQLDGARVAGLSPIDALLHAVVHYFAHHGDEHRPAQWLLDMDLLWAGLSQKQREELVDRAAAEGLSGLVAEALERTRERFSTGMDDETLQKLRAAGKGEWRTKLINLEGQPIRRILFTARAAGGWQARAGYFRKLIVPSREYMQHKYPNGSRLGLGGLYLRRLTEGFRKSRASDSERPE